MNRFGFTFLLITMSFGTVVNGDQPKSLSAYWERQGWPGEYPTGVEVINHQEVGAYSYPTTAALQEECTLMKGKYHPALGSNTLYRSKIGYYRAKEDIWSEGISSGEVITQLSYFSEGLCLVRIEEGEIFQAPCPAMHPDKYETIVAADFSDDEQWFQGFCLEGNRKWILKHDPLFYFANIRMFVVGNPNL